MRFMSRAVVHDEADLQKTLQGCSNIDHEGSPTSLTVWRKSLVLNCNGFTVIDSAGNLAYRVDDYTGGRPEDLVLMDGLGNPIFSILRRKFKLGLLENWLVYQGDFDEYSNESSRSSSSSSSSSSSKKKKQPICCVKKQGNTMLHSASNSNANNVLANVVGGNGSLDRQCAYVIEGSYAIRSCKIMEKYSRRVVAEIRPKESSHGGASFGGDVFVLRIQPGFDSGLAMAILMVLDQIFS